MIYHLVRFLEDGILYVCTENRIERSSSDRLLVRFKNLGLWEAESLASGEKHDMQQLMSSILKTGNSGSTINENEEKTTIYEFPKMLDCFVVLYRRQGLVSSAVFAALPKKKQF